MRSIIQRISLCFAAGCFGALINSLLVWYLGRLSVPQTLGVAVAPALTLHYLYPRIVWGGLWGLVFCAPIWRGGFWVGVFSRGILFSFLPTLFQLLFVFPMLQDKGMLGLTLGKLTPVFVCFYNSVWGFCTGLWLYFSKES
jgi:hypothetical protein